MPIHDSQMALQGQIGKLNWKGGRLCNRPLGGFVSTDVEDAKSVETRFGICGARTSNGGHE